MILELRPSGTLWVLRQIWNNISDMLSLDYDETQQIIKEWVEKQLKLEEIIPNCYNNSGLKEMEEELKSEEITPFDTNAIIQHKWNNL